MLKEFIKKKSKFGMHYLESVFRGKGWTAKIVDYLFTKTKKRNDLGQEITFISFCTKHEKLCNLVDQFSQEKKLQYVKKIGKKEVFDVKVMLLD